MILRTRNFSGETLVFVLPAILLLVLLLYLPAVLGFYYSLHELEGMVPGSYSGLSNYQAVIGAPEFIDVAKRTLVYIVGAVSLTLVAATGIALAVNTLTGPLATAVQIGVILPWAVSSVVGALMFRWVYVSDIGLFAYAIESLGLGPYRPLAGPVSGMLTLIASACWKKLGFAVIMILAGIKSIPADYHDAARADGATPWQAFREVTLPLLAGPLIICSVVLAIADLNTVELPLIVTNGGPVESTTILPLSIYSLAFSQFDFQGAITLAVFMFAVNVVLVASYVSITQRRATHA